MKFRYKYLLWATIIYIYVPVAVFLFGFTKLWIALITFVPMVYFILQMYKDYTKDNDSSITIKWYGITVFLTLIVAVCIMIGFGGVFMQPGDWWKHNAVIHDLVEKEWPVYYSIFEESMLTYYVGQYLVPSLIGKIANSSFFVASIAMAIWAVLGIVLVFLHLTRITKADTFSKQLRTLIIMLFFCGCLIVAQIILEQLYGERFYANGSYHWILVKNIQIQYRSNLVILRWVYPQALVPWLIIMMFYENWKRPKHYVLLVSPILLYGTFSVIFPVFAAIVCAVYLVINSKEKKNIIRNIFSLSNIYVFLSFGVIMLMYFGGNILQDKPAYSSFGVGKFTLETVPVYIVFCFFMYGIYAICVLKEQKDNLIYYIVVMALTIIPAFRMGLCNDWVMCTSIPALFLMMVFVIITLNDKQETREYGIRAAIIIICMMIGAWYPLLEVRDNITNSKLGYDNTGDGYLTLEAFSNREYTEATEDLIYNYYTYDLDGKFFYEYIARKQLSKRTLDNEGKKQAQGLFD